MSKQVVRVIKREQLDNEAPKGVDCINCLSEVDFTTAHYGRIFQGFIKKTEDKVKFSILQGQVIKTNEYLETSIPQKKTGYVCHPCYEILYNTTWYRVRPDNGYRQLTRAFES